MTSNGATTDVGEWLRGLDLGQYETLFRQNEISADVLPDLTETDLEKLGLPLGHRKRLLKAIANLTARAELPGSSSPAPASPAAQAAAQPALETVAERRHVTVMFSDLVGSTALSARIDPEDLREVIAAYQKCVAETVQRFGGFVAKYMGDGVLVYFGYPQAHEDDAERAVRAGLELIQEVAALKSIAPLQTRVGIATGLVVVGDLIGTGEAQERGIVGETPNLAARLQGIAEPNTVVIAEGTRKLFGNLFDLHDLGVQELKGIAEPVRAWGALRPAAIESRFEALHASGLTELVGRDEELELLLRRWSQAKTGEGQVVLLSGEAGIGKSRLTAALMGRLEGEPHTRLRYFCSPQHTDSALYPIIGQMERAAALAHGDTAQVKLDKLDALLAQTSTSKQDAALFAEMLSLPNDGRYSAIEPPPEQRRTKTLEALVLQSKALTQRGPVLLILEDAHWIDPTSLEAFGQIIGRIRSIPVLLLVTFRPEFDAPWVGRPYVSTIALSRLGERDIRALIDCVVGNNPLPVNIRQDIIDRTDGIPLFVEEMTKAVLESGKKGAALRTVASIPSPAVEVPASLQASLMARLDRLGSAKEVAQTGAAIGREFSHALLSAVVSKPEPELILALDRLTATGLLFRHGVPPDASYLFKHALVQDAAYGTLLRDRRRALHARISDTLEDSFAEISNAQPELLARHCTEAGQIEKAVQLWGKAGRRSLDRSALVEAIEQFTRALRLIETLPSTPALRREAIKLQVAVIAPLTYVKGPAAPETKAAAERGQLLIEQADALGEPPEDPLLLFSVLHSYWNANLIDVEGGVLRELATKFLGLAERRGAAVPLMIGHRIMGVSMTITGDLSQGRTHFNRAIAFHDPATHHLLATQFNQDVGVAILSWRHVAVWLLGYPTAALIDLNRALNDAHAIQQAATSMFTQAWAAFTQMQCGNYPEAGMQLDEVMTLAEKKGSFWTVPAMILRGLLLALTGKTSDAIQVLTSTLIASQQTRSSLLRPLRLSYLAEAYADAGRFDEGWRCIDEAKTAIESSGERWFQAETDRVAGEIALKLPIPDATKARGYFERALAVSRQQKAKSLELRAATSMARLWRDQGKRSEARDVLSPAYGWFTEGFDTRDLKEAKALLQELSP